MHRDKVVIGEGFWVQLHIELVTQEEIRDGSGGGGCPGGSATVAAGCRAAKVVHRECVRRLMREFGREWWP